MFVFILMNLLAITLLEEKLILTADNQSKARRLGFTLNQSPSIILPPLPLVTVSPLWTPAGVSSGRDSSGAGASLIVGGLFASVYV